MRLDLRQKGFLNKVSTATGVYYFLDKHNNPIYIGKALNIKQRIKQHIYNAKFEIKEKAIVTSSHYLKFSEVNSEFEALILEANLVRKLQPKYNASLKDDKSPIYIVITKDKYGKLYLKRKRDLVKNQYAFVFGPLNTTREARMLLRKIRRIIPFCTDKRVSNKPCFYSHMKLCNPCPNIIESLTDSVLKSKLHKKYTKNLRDIKKLLSGSGEKLLKKLSVDMSKFSTKNEFEKAAVTRDRIYYLKRLFQDSLILDDRLEDANFISNLRQKENKSLQELLNLKNLKRVECYDISNTSGINSTASMVVFFQGIPTRDEYRRFRIKTDKKSDPEMLLEAIKRRLSHSDWTIPDLIVIDGGKPQLLTVITGLKNTNVKVPKIIGLAKKPDRVVVSENYKTIRLTHDSLALHYLQRLRDEAHRFAKKYHLLLRKKSFFKK